MTKLPPINWPADGLIPVVIQDDENDAVLMMGFMNQESLEATRSSGEVHFWSRSRQELWHKGSGSGHVQRVRSIAINCDQNSLLIRVEQIGAVCHDGYSTCYYRDVLDDGSLAINRARVFDPRDVYGDGYGLQAITHEWWGAYQFLKDNDLAAQSGTSKLLRSSETSVINRIGEELTELAGVLDGSHVHTNQHDDAILEASQCGYWIAVESIRSRFTWDQVRPDQSLNIVEATVDAATAARVLRSEANSLQTLDPGTAHHLLQMVAEGVLAIGVQPRSILEHDLAELRERPYLTEYFAR